MVSSQAIDIKKKPSGERQWENLDRFGAPPSATDSFGSSPGGTTS
jgi:hypothetical protein